MVKYSLAKLMSEGYTVENAKITKSGSKHGRLWMFDS